MHFCEIYMFRKVFFYFIRAVVLLVSKFEFSILEKILNLFLYELNKVNKCGFITFHSRPSVAVKYAIDSFKVNEVSSTAIIIQGPIIDEFTIQTVYFYQKSHPDCILILSSWKGEEHKIPSDLNSSDKVHLIFSDKPNMSGACNVNFQIVSTINALIYAEKLGVKYCYKTRTDQRMYAYNTVPYMVTLLNLYSPVDDFQHKRIIELSMNILRLRPYSMCDMFQFGAIFDLLKFWSVELDQRNITAQEYSSKLFTFRDISEDEIAEIYLHRHYLRRIGDNASVDYNNYYAAVRDRFIVIDKETIDLYWHKYSAFEYKIAFNPCYDADRRYARINHIEWLCMYFKTIKNIPEEINLDTREL